MSIEKLCDILRHDGPIAACRYRTKPDYAPLIRAGLVEESGLVEDWYCDDCSLGHAASIVFEQGRYGYFCPELGFVPVERKQLVAVSARVETFVSCLADLLNVSNRKTSPIRGQTWRIGRLRSEHGDLSLYYHPNLVSADDLLNLQGALADEVGTRFRLVLTATGILPIEGRRSVALSDVFEISQDGNVHLTANPWALAGFIARPPTGRPNTYRAPVKDLALQRIASEEAHSALKTEAKTIKELLWDAETKTGPSLTTCKRYLTEVREWSKGGQN